MNCNEINQTAAELKMKFEAGSILSANDLDLLVELTLSARDCSGEVSTIDSSYYKEPLENLTNLTNLNYLLLEDNQRHYVKSENKDYFWNATATSGDYEPFDKGNNTLGFWVATSYNDLSGVPTSQPQSFIDNLVNDLATIEAKRIEENNKISGTDEIDLSLLITTIKDNLINAINENKAKTDSNKTDIDTNTTNIAGISAGEIYAIPRATFTPSTEPTPTKNGNYRAEAGTYTNWGGTVVPATDGFIYSINVSDVETTPVYKVTSVELNIESTSNPDDADQTKFAQIGAVKAERDARVESLASKVDISKLETVTKNVITGNNSDMSGLNDWVQSIGTPNFDINNTFSDRMFINFTTGNQAVKLPNKLTIGKTYTITFTAKTTSGVLNNLVVGLYTSTIGDNVDYVRLTPNEKNFKVNIVASTVDLFFGIIAVDNTGVDVVIGDVKAYQINEVDINYKDRLNFIEDLIVDTELLIGTNRYMSGSNDWIAGLGTPAFDINTTVVDNMFIDFTTGNQEIKISNILTIGEKYKVKFKARLNAGTSMPVRIGAFVGTITNQNAFDILPTSIQQDFEGEITASSVNFSIGALTATNIGSNFEITDFQIILNAEININLDNILPINIKSLGVVGNGVDSDSLALQKIIDSYSGSNLELYFPSGKYLLGGVNIDGFESVTIKGFNAEIIAETGNTYVISITNGSRLEVSNLFNNVNFVNLTDGFFKVENFIDYANFDKVHFKNFGHNTAYGFKFLNVSLDTDIGGQETGIGISLNQCNFYNDQLILLANFDYATSTWLGRGIFLGQGCEYWRVENCYFRCIHVGMDIEDGANGSIIGCNFSYTNSYDWSTSTNRGSLNILDTVDNNGKLIVSGCHFNHNYGTSIMSKYDQNGRPMTIVGNHFIANAYTTIEITDHSRNRISNNFFDRANGHIGLQNDPFTSNDSAYVKLLVDSVQNTIESNDFSGGGTELTPIVSTGISRVNKVVNNNYASGTVLANLSGTGNIERDNDNIL